MRRSISYQLISAARLGHIKLTDMGLAKVVVGKCCAQSCFKRFKRFTA